MVIRRAVEHPGYSADDRARYLDEPAKRGGRTEFARDRARIIHSFALRRLAAKTQVAVPWATIKLQKVVVVLKVMLKVLDY